MHKLILKMEDLKKSIIRSDRRERCYNYNSFFTLESALFVRLKKWRTKGQSAGRGKAPPTRD